MNILYKENILYYANIAMQNGKATQDYVTCNVINIAHIKNDKLHTTFIHIYVFKYSAFS